MRHTGAVSPTALLETLVAPTASGSFMSATRTPASIPEVSWRLHPTKWSVVRAVVRRLVPFLVEATLIPTVLFYAFLAALGLFWAFIASAGWSLACVARRLVRRQTVPGLLVLACLGISVRTGIYVWSSNPVIYFLQPVLRTLLTAGAFALSVVIGRPLIARFAHDFCRA